MEIGLRDLLRTTALMLLAFGLIMLLLLYNGGMSAATNSVIITSLGILLVCAGLFDLIWLNSKRRRKALAYEKLTDSEVRENNIAVGRRLLRTVSFGSVTVFSLIALHTIVELLRR